jgi:twitching motility protein PilI
VSNASARTPLGWLIHIEKLCLCNAQDLPQQHDDEDKWPGIGFMIGRLHLVAPLEEVAEILTPMPLSRVPRTKPWLCGIANVRGNLMPVMDLQSYFDDRPAVSHRRSRILVINHHDVYSGVIVDAVLGLKHFRHDQRCGELPGDDRIRAYMRDGFRVGLEHWGVFSMHALAEAPQFLHAAV